MTSSAAVFLLVHVEVNEASCSHRPPLASPLRPRDGGVRVWPDGFVPGQAEPLVALRAKGPRGGEGV